MFDNTPNQTSMIKNWVKRNDELGGKYEEDDQIKFKTSMLRSNLCDYSNAYIFFKVTITTMHLIDCEINLYLNY